jgi:hypothetical protein
MDQHLLKAAIFVAVAAGIVAAHLVGSWLILRKYSARASYFGLFALSLVTTSTWLLAYMVTMFAVYPDTPNPPTTNTTPDRAVVDLIFAPTSQLNVFGVGGCFGTIPLLTAIFFVLGLLLKTITRNAHPKGPKP